MGRETEAAAALEEHLRADPSSAAAWTNLGVLRLRAGSVEGAREALLRATGADPSMVEPRLALADLEALQGDFGMALRISVKAAEVAPGSVPARVKAGEISMLLGQPLKAEEWFRKALGDAPGDAGARRGLAGALAFRGRSALAEGKVPEAVALTREATELDPGGTEPWFAAGEVLRAAGDATGALEAFRRAGANGDRAAAASARAGILMGRALALRAKGDAAAARGEAERALAEGAGEIRAPGSRTSLREELRWIPAAPAGGEARAWLLDGLLALAAGEEGRAAAALSTVVGMEGPRGGAAGGELHAAGLVLRSRARLAADDLDGALTDLEALAAAAPPGTAGARARFLLGHALSGRAARRRSEARGREADGDSSRAAALLERAREEDRTLVEASIALAEMHFVEGRAVEAIRELNALLAADPDRVEAHLVLGNLMKAQFTESAERSYLEDAEEHFRRVLALDPGDARALAGLGEMAAFSNRPKEALAYALRALNADPDLPAARSLAATLFLRVGRGHVEEGNAEAALEMARRAGELGGETAALCLLRSDALRKKGEWAAAGAEVERARTLDPGSPEVKDALAAHYRDVGYAFLLHRRRDQAGEAFRRAVAAGSERVDLAEVKRFLEGGEEGPAAAERPDLNPAVAEALEKAMEEARRRHGEGADLLRAGKREEAAEAFRASLRSFETAHARFGLGLALAASGDGEGAEREYRRAAADDPGFADAWLNLGALLYRRGADAEAEEAYLAYLRHAPQAGAEETVARVEAIVAVLRERRGSGGGGR
ncbi:MAG: tetratricopeptide repeat protein [Planctomycetes bacterium]|nr:tetratricopeptide repeat protein [Planctomycetota bacterium]